MSDQADERGEITLPMGGEEFCLRPSMEAIKAIQRETGKSLYSLSVAAQAIDLSLDQCEIIATEMMKAWGKSNEDDPRAVQHRGANRETVGQMIFEAGDAKIQPRLAVALIAALTGGVTASGELKAPEPKKATRSAK
jgi:hypothetical protein